MVRAILGYNVIVNMFTALGAAVLTEEVLAIVKNLTLKSEPVTLGFNLLSF